MSDAVKAIPAGHPSMTTPIAGPCDSPKEETQKSFPNIQFNIQENIERDVEFSAIHAYHLYRILQEAINNALKHSGCSALHIDFYSCNHWVITISDNGSGFEAIQYARGSGIDNIKNRAAASGWKVNWEKNEPNGTKVIITGNG